MSSFNSTQSFNQAISMNRVSEVHPNQGYYIKTLGTTDYQYNTMPIANDACGCAGKSSYPAIHASPHAWNVSYQDQPQTTNCPYVVTMDSQPGDGGMTSFCATQE